MTYLLDTDILSNLMRKAPSPKLLERLAAVPREQQFTSSITAGELLFGAYRLGPSANGLLQRIERALQSSHAILPFDLDAARRYAAVRADLERRGIPLADADLRIAAIALARGLTLVTGNRRHFARVPALPIQNWLL